MASASTQFGPFLKRRLQERGMSQADLARQTGVTGTAVYNWLRGTQPGAAVIGRLARALDVDRERLAVLTGHADPSQANGTPSRERLPAPGDTETPRERLARILDDLSDRRIDQLADFADFLAMKDWRDEWQEAALAGLALAIEADERINRMSGQ